EVNFKNAQGRYIGAKALKSRTRKFTSLNMDEIQGKRTKTHNTSSTTSMELEKEQEKQVETSNNTSVDWSEDVDLEFSVGEDPTDTGSSSSEERENSPGNMKEHSGKTAENDDVMNVIMQNDYLNPNLGNNAINSRIKSSEG
ncbi:18434_t:CDS:2, partial [Dentiscutata erythropus]